MLRVGKRFETQHDEALVAMTSAKPRGWYLADDVGQLAGISSDQVGQWARHGYIRSSQSEEEPRVYSFQDIAEAMVVHELIERGVHREDIRRTIDNLRALYGDWPLSVAPLATTRGARPGGREHMVLQQGAVNRAIGRRDGSQLFLPSMIDLERITDQLRRGGWVTRVLQDLRHIEVDPDRLSGRPTIRGRRVPADMVAALARTSEGRESLAEDYELTPDEIDDAVRWYSAATRYGRAA